MQRILSTFALVALVAATAAAHDTWVETNTNLVHTGDAVYIDLKLGNHGNNHRDFKLASKVNPGDGTWEVISPEGEAFDLRSVAIDTGYAPKEGFWNAKYVTDKPGLYTVAHTRDKVVNHGQPTRSIKSGKAYFVASDSLDQIPTDFAGFDKPLGHPLELVPTVHPVTPMGPGQEIEVRLLFQGQPLADAVVSFVPRRETLQTGFDETYERKADSDGVARFTPKTGDQYLIVAHHKQPEAGGEGYEATAYSATLTVFVPERCPCCGE